MLNNSPRSLRIGLILLFFIALGTLVMLILMQRGIIGNNVSSIEPATNTKKSPLSNQREKRLSAPVTPTLTTEDANRQLSDIVKDQTEGKISLEEAQRQMNAISAKAPLPIAPTDTKK